MQLEQEFKHFYKSDLVHSLVFTEKERKSIVLKIVLSIVLPIIFIPTLAVLWLETYEELYLVPAIVLLIGSPIYINRLFGDTLFYKNFKRKIIGKIIKYINPTLEYDNVQKVDDVEYDNSKFFDNTNTIIYGDDHVSGVINDVRVEFSELLVEFKSDADKKEFNNKYQFRGIFFIGEFKRNFSSELIVKTNSLYFPGQPQQLVVNDKFNKVFKTKAVKNPENVDKILTPEVVDAMLLLQERIHNDFMISFADNRIYIGIYHDEDLFEPTLFQSMQSFDKIKGYFDDLYFPILFIEEVTKQLSK
ncbi:MAG: DUF3137 domain-containing protein [Bacteroidota bacterium]|nr:DUF3137 domain-containing protein [Bacteroidota bacterium]